MDKFGNKQTDYSTCQNVSGGRVAVMVERSAITTPIETTLAGRVQKPVHIDNTIQRYHTTDRSADAERRYAIISRLTFFFSIAKL